MNKLLIAFLLAFATASAFAQSGPTVTTSDDKGRVEAITPVTPEQKSADAFCLRETGSHLSSYKNKPHGDRAVECATQPGRVYTREDLDRTGAISTKDALRRLDPSVH